MKILFLHAALGRMTAEYKVHQTLAKHGTPNIESHFVWQQSNAWPSEMASERNSFIDFGREELERPHLSRIGRVARGGMLFPLALRKLAELVKSINPDAIYSSQQRYDVLLARLISRLFNLPHVIHIHYNVGPWLGRIALQSIRRSKNLIAVSEYTRQTAMLAGVESRNIITIRNPIPDEAETIRVDRDIIRAEFGYGNDTPLVLSVGRLDPGKGHVALVQAFHDVTRELPAAKLLICGQPSYQGPYEFELRRRIVELGLEGNVTLAGQRSDIRSLMRCSDVFCLPTELDPCPLVFLEASAEGLPSVAYHSGGVPELISHGQTGLLSYPRNQEALARNLLRVLKDRDLAQRLGQRAKLTALEKFHPGKAALLWHRALNEMVGNR